MLPSQSGYRLGPDLSGTKSIKRPGNPRHAVNIHDGRARNKGAHRVLVVFRPWPYDSRYIICLYLGLPESSQQLAGPVPKVSLAWSRIPLTIIFVGCYYKALFKTSG